MGFLLFIRRVNLGGGKMVGRIMVACWRGLERAEEGEGMRQTIVLEAREGPAQRPLVV